MENIINFQHITLPNKPNYYLVCPDNVCPQAIKNNDRVITSQKFDRPINQLLDQWQHLVKNDKRMVLFYEDPAQQQYAYTVYTKWLRFPDNVNIKFIPLTDDTSTLAIYSQSQYGYYDFHANRKRIQSWLKALSEEKI